MTPAKLTKMHLMAFIYLALADIDDDPTEKEMSVAITKLREWEEDDQKIVTRIIQESFEWYMAAKDDGVIGTEIGNNLHVFDGFNEDHRKAILGDMIEIIKADGLVDPRETKYFGAIADCLGIDLG
jgi:uncharacterized tellurite resistance protein B-like protein